MNKGNVRYGVVNDVNRNDYEKEWQLPYGYSHLTYDKQEAIAHCRDLKNSDFIVEEIYDTAFGTNFKNEIYRSGKENEKNS